LAFRAAASQPVWQRRMLWVFVLALIPLAFNILVPDSGDNAERFAQTIEQLDLTHQIEIATLIEADEQGTVANPLQKLFMLLPDHRLKDAFLAYDSSAHWFMAAGASLLFMGLLVAMSMDGSSRAWQLLVISTFTATGGIVLLLAFQYLADWAADGSVRGRGIVALFFLLVKLIGYSYRAALTDGNGFLPSMLGFTFGVGLCEEFCKAIPLFAYFKNSAGVTWRGAMLWGLASGIGFGIAEGIMYSGDYYNGRAYAGIYFVRFFSCVALHAIWTATVAITLYRRQDEWQSADEWYEHGLVVLKIIFIPMLLHGLYDTLLKQDYAVYALLTAAASFGYLGWLNYHCERHE
jgi:RsiW-degrading membrane proteinase PrsW (M82 family)